MLNKTGRAVQPGNGLFHVSIIDVREYYISRHRAIWNHCYRPPFLRSHPARATVCISNGTESGAGVYCKKASQSHDGHVVIPLVRVGLVLRWHDVRQIPKIMDEVSLIRVSVLGR